MDIDKLIKFGSDNLAGYFDQSVGVLTAPRVRFASAGDLIDRDSIREPGSRATFKADIVLFALISLFLGSTLNALIPNRRVGPDLTTAVIAGLLSWIAYASVAHLLCKLLRGRGSFSQTLSATLQIIAITYVVASMVALSAGGLSTAVSKLVVVNGLARTIAENPVIMYFAVHWALLTVYLPLSLGGLHGFGWIRTLAVGVVPLFGLALGIAMYLTYGLLEFGAPV